MCAFSVFYDGRLRLGGGELQGETERADAAAVPAHPKLLQGVELQDHQEHLQAAG